MVVGEFAADLPHPLRARALFGLTPGRPFPQTGLPYSHEQFSIMGIDFREGTVWRSEPDHQEGDYDAEQSIDHFTRPHGRYASNKEPHWEYGKPERPVRSPPTGAV
ncbi:hypothetical protein GCM10017790_79820 [Amycolatopsis oliviviridis]|uniref:Uncharacterized protein n=1 Tax=Amycolatopsis oliviviridis TaxID=1471590 RepID=A0ABQ3MAJ4_9PSEU|nr:hypothetical protein GCM10017790_79820 [Amycolatopsis oliviviridis]